MRFDIDVALIFGISIAVLYFLMRWVNERLDEKEMFKFYIYGVIFGIIVGAFQVFSPIRSFFSLILFAALQEGFKSILGIYKKYQGLEIFLSCAGMGIAAGISFLTYLAIGTSSYLDYLAAAIFLISYTAIHMFNGAWIGKSVISGKAWMGFLPALFYNWGFWGVLALVAISNSAPSLAYPLLYSLPSLYLTKKMYERALRA